MKGQTLYEALQRVVGKTVTDVTFIEDYVQFTWPDAVLSAYTSPKLVVLGTERLLAEEDYRGAFWDLEGKLLQAAYVIPGESVILVFGETEVTVSLRNEDYIGPEAIQFALTDSSSAWVA